MITPCIINNYVEGHTTLITEHWYSAVGLHELRQNRDWNMPNGMQLVPALTLSWRDQNGNTMQGRRDVICQIGVSCRLQIYGPHLAHFQMPADAICRAKYSQRQNQQLTHNQQHSQTPNKHTTKTLGILCAAAAFAHITTFRLL